MIPLPPGPDYGSDSLAGLLPSAAALLGVEGFTDTLGLGHLTEQPNAVTVLLVDGLGWEAWRLHAELTPHLASMAARPMSATVPSTTPTALASLGMGAPPGSHGVVGSAFRLPEDDVMLHPLTWRTSPTGETPHPLAVQPEPTVFERLAARGIPVLTVGAAAYAESGLTRAVLRGGRYVGSDDTESMVSAVAGHRRGLAYAYVSELDRTGHVHGVDSDAWRHDLGAVDELVGRLLDRMDPGHRLIVTADHGMVDCPPEDRVRMEELPHYEEVTVVGGEPRMRHAYVRTGAAADVAATWQGHLGDRAWVLTRDDLVASGMLGPVEEHNLERIGDVVVMSTGRLSVTSDADPHVSALLGQHGSLTAAELAIPLLQAAGRG